MTYCDNKVTTPCEERCWCEQRDYPLPPEEEEWTPKHPIMDRYLSQQHAERLLLWTWGAGVVFTIVLGILYKYVFHL